MGEIYETPWNVGDDDPRTFYHTIDVPGEKTQYGEWDLRKGVDAYLSDEPYRGRRVLEIGTANGFVCFELEKRGAEVVSFDLAEGLSYDIVPGKDVDRDAAIQFHVPGIKAIKNAYWWAHQRHRSQARVVYGHATRIPEEIGPVDCVFMGNVLQHMENPFAAVASAARLTQSIVVTEAIWVTSPNLDDKPVAFFLPSIRKGKAPLEWCFSWWQVTPRLVREWLEILGFRVVSQTEHKQFMRDTSSHVPHFTIRAERT